MPVRLQCKCEAVLALHDRYVGRKARCPECRWEFVVPQPKPGLEVVPTADVEAYGARALTPPPQSKGPDLDFKRFQEMLGHAGDEELPSLPDDLKTEPGAHSAEELSPDKTATEIIVEKAFGSPQSEYERLRDLLGSDPDAPHLYSQLGDVCLSLGKRDEAVEAYDQAIKLDKSYDYLEGKIEELLGPQEYAKRLVEGTMPSEPEAPEPGAEEPPGTPPPAFEDAALGVASTPTPAEPSATPPPVETAETPPAATTDAPALKPDFVINDVLLYPLRSGGRISIVVCSLLATAMWYAINDLFATAGPYDQVPGREIQFLVAQIVAATLFGLTSAYVLVFHLKVIATSSRGQVTVTEWPRLDRWWEEILSPLLCMLFHLILCVIIPATILRVLMPITAETPELERDYIRAVRLVILLALGFFYLPMAGVLASIAPGVVGLNPLRIVIGMVQTVRYYIVALFLFALSLGAVAFTWYVDTKLAIFFPLDLPLWMLAFFFSIATSRALGCLYAVNRDDLVGDRALGLVSPAAAAPSQQTSVSPLSPKPGQK